ncbi:MAG: Panacea domain-containing protein, partial [bacterium]
LALKTMDQPITGDRYVSMDYGPVLRGVYDLIKGQPVDSALPLWSKYISPRDSNYVDLLQYPGNEELCEEEEMILKQVYETFGHLDPFLVEELCEEEEMILKQVYETFVHLDPFLVSEWTHDLPEWKDPHGSAIPILVEDVLGSMGKTEEEIEDISQEAQREAYLDGALPKILG